MPDQADNLREWVRARSGLAAPAGPPGAARGPSMKPARSLVLTSGKGGVGTSNLALNLAIALGRQGQKVVLVDADLGLANIDLLCGLAPPCDLGDVLAGDATLEDATVEGPAGVRIVAGAHGARGMREVPEDAAARLVDAFEPLQAGADFLLVDAGSGLGPAVLTLAEAVAEVVVVATPEPASVAGAHAAIARLRRPGGGGPRVRALVNQARSRAEAAAVLAGLVAASRQFLGVAVRPLGAVRHDRRVPAAVRARRPFLEASPGSIASRGVRRLARDLVAEGAPGEARAGSFAARAARWASGRFPRQFPAIQETLA